MSDFIQKFESLPVEVEAVQFTGENGHEILEWIIAEGGVAVSDSYNKEMVIRTVEGDMAANPEWWIIRGTEGEFYPCKPSVFERKYKLKE